MTIASEALGKRLRPLLARRPGVVEKKMFGGIGFMLHGNMVVGTTAAGDLLVRVDPDKLDAALKRPGAFQMMMGERPMKGFVAVAAADVPDPEDLKHWIDFAMDYTRTLPRKENSPMTTRSGDWIAYGSLATEYAKTLPPK